MAVPVQFKNMPEHIWASHTFGKSNPLKNEVGGQLSADDDMTTLKFPGTKNILWDHTSTGKPVNLHVSYYRKPRLNLSDKVLRYAQRHTESLKKLECRGLLIGSLIVDEDGEGVSINIDSLHVEHSENSPTSHAPGDLLVPFQISNSGKDKKTCVEDYKNTIQLLKERCCSRDAVDLSNFLLTNGWCRFYANGEKSVHHVEFHMVTIADHFKAIPISPVPIVPTALSKNLAGPLSMSHVQGTPKTGYLTMDHTRKLLLVLESDPKICNLPIVGIWISGASFIHNPFVWACCLRYLHNSSMQDRVCSPPEPFLLVLYSPLHSKPEFYECITTSGKSTMNFELYAGYEPFNVYKTNISSPDSITSIYLNLVDNGPSKDIFTAAVGGLQSSSAGNSKNSKPTNDNDMVPRCIPTPQRAQHPIIQPMVPELSLIMMDESPVHRPASLQSRPQQFSDSEAVYKSAQSMNNMQNHPTLPVPCGSKSNSSCQSSCCQNARSVKASCNKQNSCGLSCQTSSSGASQPLLQNLYSMQNRPIRSPACVNPPSTGPHMPVMSNIKPQPTAVNSAVNTEVGTCSNLSSRPCCSSKVPFTSGQFINTHIAQNHVFSQAPHIGNIPLASSTGQHAGSTMLNGPMLIQNPCHQNTRPQQGYNCQSDINSLSTQHLQNNIQHNLPNSQRMFQPISNAASMPPSLSCISEESADRVDNLDRPGNISNRSSEDSGLSVTPERNNSNPNTGKTKSNSPNLKNDSGNSTGLTLQNSNINWNQVPPEIYQLLHQQDSQLKQLQAQIQHLLISQSTSSNSCHNSSDSVSQTSMGQIVPQKLSNDVQRKTSNSGMNSSDSYSHLNINNSRDHVDTCSVATNTTMIYPVSNQVIASDNPKSASQQTSPHEHDMSEIRAAKETTVPTSEGDTPSEIRHRGVLPLNSTQREDSDCVNLSQGDLMSVVNKLAFEKTVESMHSDMIVDLPSYQSSPVRSMASVGSGSQGKSSSTPSPLSASMYEQQGQDDADEDDEESDGEEAELTDGDQQVYYDKLLSNIRNLLDRHSNEQEDESQQLDLTENISSELPTYVQEKVQLMENIQSFVRYDNASFNATIVPNINYNSAVFDSDSDCSMEINAMAMKYLKDEQLTQLMKLQTSTLFKKAKQDQKNVMLRRLLSVENDGTPNVTTMGISPNNLTIGTKQYMEKYGLLNDNNCDINQSFSPLDKTIQLKVDYSMTIDTSSRPEHNSPYANASGRRSNNDHLIYPNTSPVRNSPRLNNQHYFDNQGQIYTAHGDRHPKPTNPTENVYDYQQCLPERLERQPQRLMCVDDDQIKNLNQPRRSPIKNISPRRPVHNPAYRQHEEEDNILDIPKLKQLPKLL